LFQVLHLLRILANSSRLWCAVFGICPIIATTAKSSCPQVVATNSSSWELKGLEKAMLLSQSSETNRIVNVPFAARLADH
jgi:hypothetical protein